MQPSSEPVRAPWWQSHIGAVLTGLAAVGAAWVAASATGAANRDAVQEETRRLATQRNDDARGAARILINELLIAGHEISDLAADAYMRPLGRNFRISIS